MDAWCFGSAAAAEIAQRVAVALTRYADFSSHDRWKGAFLCNYFFDNQFMSDYDIHGFNAILVRNRQELPINDSVYDFYFYKPNDKDYWYPFWSKVAEIMVDRIFHYGADNAQGCEEKAPMSVIRSEIKWNNTTGFELPLAKVLAALAQMAVLHVKSGGAHG